MTWVGGGYWRPLLHELADDARMDTAEGGRRIWWSGCNSMCVVLPPGTPLDRFGLCEKCFPDGQPAIRRTSPREIHSGQTEKG